VLAFQRRLRARRGFYKRLGAEIDAVLLAARRGPTRPCSGIGKPLRHGDRLGARRGRDFPPARPQDQSDRAGHQLRRAAAHDGCAADPHCSGAVAIVGSIALWRRLPKPHRLLKKNEIDFEEITAGRVQDAPSRSWAEITHAGANISARSSTPTNTLQGQAFAACRPKVDIDRVANGRQLVGAEKGGAGLVDAIMTGDDCWSARPRQCAPLRSATRSAQDPAASSSKRAWRRGADGGRIWFVARLAER